ncbi:MAG: gamma-glutamyltransferase family protein [Casimicrobiaceae bacterium]
MDTTGKRGIVVAPQPIAVSVGAEILRQRGNAVDAAIATALVQGVVDPCNGGIGGFGCMLIHDVGTGRTVSVGYHGRAGSRARPDVFADDVVGQIHGHAERYEVRDAVNQVGYRSVVVPGALAGFDAAHRRYGRLPWAALFEPAIGIARDGVPLPGEVYAHWTDLTEPGHKSGLERIRTTAACAAIFAPGGELLKPGQLLRQPDYAAVLERIARTGADDFYCGEIGRAIADDFGQNDGLFDAGDLARYRAEVVEPVAGSYRGLEIRSAPLPASGVQVVELLHVLEQLDVAALRREGEAAYVHRVGRAMLATFADRARFLGDPGFVEVPIDRLVSTSHAAKVAALVRSDQPISVESLGYAESAQTTHNCVMDAEGNAVSLTHTLGSASGVVTPGLGFIYNNCMYQFHPFPGHPNSIAPGKSRMTGAAPTLVMRAARPWMALGALGGTRMPTAIVNALLAVVEQGMRPVEAVEAARFHAEGPWLEMESRLYWRLHRELESLGWKLRPSAKGYDRAFAMVFMAMRREDGAFAGGSDPRGGGGIAII